MFVIAGQVAIPKHFSFKPFLLLGVYNISIDAEEGTVKVTGRVNPNTLLRVLERYGRHAEVKWIRFDGEVRERGYYYYGENGYVPSPYAPAPYGVSYHYPVPARNEYPPIPYGGLVYPWYDSCRHIRPLMLIFKMLKNYLVIIFFF